MEYNGIIFDFGNVIATFSDTTFTDSLSAYCSKSSESLHKLIYSNTDIKREYEMGLMSSDEFFTKIKELTGADINRVDFIKIYTDIFTPIPETLALIRKLKPNYKLGLLSNTSEWDFLYGIQAVDIYDLFDAVTVSYQMKAFKPDAALYFDMMKKLALCPQECIYIDDIKEFAIAAESIGMRGIHYLDPKELLSTLSDLGIKV